MSEHLAALAPPTGRIAIAGHVTGRARVLDRRGRGRVIDRLAPDTLPPLEKAAIEPVPQQVERDLHRAPLSVIDRRLQPCAGPHVLTRAECHLHLRNEIEIGRRAVLEITVTQQLDHRRPEPPEALSATQRLADSKAAEDGARRVGGFNGQVCSRLRLNEALRGEQLTERAEHLEHADARAEPACLVAGREMDPALYAGDRSGSRVGHERPLDTDADVADAGQRRACCIVPEAERHRDLELISHAEPVLVRELAHGVVDAIRRHRHKRADLWAFGATLYEMLTGCRAFRGGGVSDTMARVLMEEPDWTALPANTLPAIRTLLRRCLEKNRRRRLDSAAAARFAIEDALTAPAGEIVEATRPRHGRTMVLAAAASSSVAMLAALLWVVMRPVSQLAVLPSRFAIVPPPAQPLNTNGDSRDVALSPDGRRLVYRSGGSLMAGSPLMIRAVDQLDAQPLPGISSALGPFFSADSHWIGFFENGELRKISISGGPAITICSVTGTSLGATWGDDNTIVFATSAPGVGLWRVSADGGEPEVLTKLDASRHETRLAFPSMLPGSRSVLFTATGTAGGAANVQVAVLDLKSHQRKTLVRGGSDAAYVETGPGCVEHADRSAASHVGVDVQRGKSGQSVRRQILGAISCAHVRRVGGRPAVPGDERQRGRRSERDASQHGRGPQLGRGAEGAGAAARARAGEVRWA